jgi:hypothetical protein
MPCGRSKNVATEPSEEHAVGHDMFDLFHAESERILGVGAPVSP